VDSCHYWCTLLTSWECLDQCPSIIFKYLYISIWHCLFHYLLLICASPQCPTLLSCNNQCKLLPGLDQFSKHQCQHHSMLWCLRQCAICLCLRNLQEAKAFLEIGIDVYILLAFCPFLQVVWHIQKCDKNWQMSLALAIFLSTA